MEPPLAAARRQAGLTQQELGQAVLRRLGKPVTPGSARKRVARWESGETSPSADEIHALAAELDLDIAQLAAMFVRAPQQATDILTRSTGLSERSLIAACCLSKTRARILEESLDALRKTVESGKVSLASFVPYPHLVALPDSTHHVSHLVGYYAAVRKSLVEFTRNFQDSLSPERRSAVALYFPRSEFERNSMLLIPPIFRQFWLVFHANAHRVVRRELYMSTPAIETDTSRPIRATGVYSVDDQMDAWQSFFGGVVERWIETDGVLLDRDTYWENVAAR